MTCDCDTRVSAAGRRARANNCSPCCFPPSSSPSATMPFPFSFVFSVPGIANPFTPIEAHHSPSTVRAPSPASTSSQGTKKPKLGMSGKIFSLNRPLRTDSFRRRPPTPCLEPPQPTSRKRGWVPSSSEPSIPTTLPATVQTSASSCLSPSPSNIGNDMQVCSEQHHEDDMEAGECIRVILLACEQVGVGTREAGAKWYEGNLSDATASGRPTTSWSKCMVYLAILLTGIEYLLVGQDAGHR